MLLKNNLFLSYPFSYRKKISLKNGTVIHIRSIQGGDESAFRSFFEMLSEESIYFRFGSRRINLDHNDLARFCLVDYNREIAFLAVVPGENEIIIGDVRLNRLSDLNTAELSLVIADQWQGLGVGSLLMDFCLIMAKKMELTTVLMEVMKTNIKMKRLGFKYGFRRRPNNSGYDMDELELKIGWEEIPSMSMDEKHFPTNTLVDSWTTVAH